MSKNKNIPKVLKRWGSRRKLYTPDDVLEHLLNEKGWTLTDVANKFDCSVPTILYWARKYNISYGSNKRSTVFVKRIKEKGFKNVSSFFRDPKIKAMTTPEIAEYLGTSSMTVRKWRETMREQHDAKRAYYCIFVETEDDKVLHHVKNPDENPHFKTVKECEAFVEENHEMFEGAEIIVMRFEKKLQIKMKPAVETVED